MKALVPEAAHYAEARALADEASLPARWSNVSFGTAGWTDPTLLQSHRFYPKGASKPEARLRHYARHFDLVEVDATYYTLLSPDVVSRWVSWTPSHFRFDVKAHASMTGHLVDLQRLPHELRDGIDPELVARGRLEARLLPDSLLQQMWTGFERSIAPLREADRLGAVLMQFPPKFTATRGNARHLEALAERWQSIPICIEFRHPSWLASERRGRVFDLVEKLGWAYVIVDEPDTTSGGVPVVEAVTRPDLAVFRLHGQNTAGWHRGASVVERFDYLYRPAELRSWVAPVQRVAREAKRVHVVFNNCVRDYAVVNAKGLSVLLAREGSVPTTV
jgi:uncharacterized protein YecE (DUF72 family)